MYVPCSSYYIVLVPYVLWLRACRYVGLSSRSIMQPDGDPTCIIHEPSTILLSIISALPKSFSCPACAVLSQRLHPLLALVFCKVFICSYDQFHINRIARAGSKRVMLLPFGRSQDLVIHQARFSWSKSSFGSIISAFMI